MKLIKHIIFFGKTNGFYKGFKSLDNGVEFIPITTFEVEESKMYTTKNGAMTKAYDFIDYEPQLMEIELEITPIALGEKITKNKILEAKEIIRKKENERLNSKLDREKKHSLRSLE